MKVSVIVPVYNAQAYLEECFRSLTEQTLWNKEEEGMELIFVNDASEDDSLEMLRHFRMIAPDRITVINLEENHGPGGARNAGISVAKGDYIAFMDSDDLIQPEMYERLYDTAVMENNMTDVVDSGVANEADGTVRFYTTKETAGNSDARKKSLQLLNVGYVWSRIYRRNFICENHIVFRENAVMEDQDFLSEVIVRAENTSFVEEAFYFYRNIPDSASKRDAESEFFHSTIETIQATYYKLSKIPGYEEVRLAVEYNFWQLYAMNLEAIDAYVENQIIDMDMGRQMQTILLQVMRECVHTLSDNNCYVRDKLSAEERQRIKTGGGF